MDNKFETILTRWGTKVLIDVRNLAECMEWYEDCAEINKVLVKHDISTNFDTEDWINEFQKRGCSGLTAFINQFNYFYDAVNLLYSDRMDEITAPYKHININRI